MSNFPKGIDVSNHQGDFDWYAWNGHIQFAFIKASDGRDYRDVQFERNWKMSEDIAIHRAPYHYCRPDHDPAAQARYFSETIGSDHEGVLGVDLEEDGGMSPINVSFWAFVFCHTLKRLHPRCKIVVYTYPWFAEQGYCAMLGGYPLWIANYDVPSPYVPKPWHNWQFWQNTGHNLDMDVFNGTEKDLEKFFSYL